MLQQELNYQMVTKAIKSWPAEQRFHLLQELLNTLAPNTEMPSINRQDIEAGIEEERPAWHTIAGIAPAPVLGEDAQKWVSRTRREGEDRRERALREAL